MKWFNLFLRSILTFSSLMFILNSCDILDSDNGGATKKDPTPVPFETLGIGDIDSKCTLRDDSIEPQQTEDSLSQFEIVITNKKEFDKYILCYEDTTEVNFDENFVIAGKSIMFPSCVYVKQCDLKLSSDTLKFNVVVGDQICAAPETAEYIIMLSNKYINYPVDFNIKKVE